MLEKNVKQLLTEYHLRDATHTLRFERALESTKGSRHVMYRLNF